MGDTAAQRTKKRGSRSFKVAVQPLRNHYLARPTSLVVPRQGSRSSAVEPQLPDLPALPSTNEKAATPSVFGQRQVNVAHEDASAVLQSLSPKLPVHSPRSPTPPTPWNPESTRGVTLNPLPHRQPIPVRQPVNMPVPNFPYFCPFNDVVDGKWTCPGRVIESGDDLVSHVLSTHKLYDREHWSHLRTVWDQTASGLDPVDCQRLDDWMFRAQ